jgi:hypothetical protein
MEFKWVAAPRLPCGSKGMTGRANRLKQWGGWGNVMRRKGVRVFSQDTKLDWRSIIWTDHFEWH